MTNMKFLQTEMSMAGTLRIAAAQMNTRVNDIRANVDAIKAACTAARAQGAELLVTPELSITGYPLEDSLENPDILEMARKGLEELRVLSAQGEPAMLVGLPQRMDGGKIYNTAVLLHQGQIKGLVRKSHLPNYDVFDEQRNFAAGAIAGPLSFKGHKLGVMICEDTWFPDVAQAMKTGGADVLISMNASPAEAGKPARRLHDVIGKRVAETGLPLLYVNQVGGQDEVVFDGYSLGVNPDGAVFYSGRGFAEALDVLNVNIPARGPATFAQGPLCAQEDDKLEYIWQTLVTGTRDYFAKKGFTKAILGMSGGIDSAVVAAIAVDALGPEN
ncbi:MAG: NAD+ synthase, partial [Alphaproteobacteria bacterium]|nr:NAD+ synthase [Alphaproteobacteria bacterium]